MKYGDLLLVFIAVILLLTVGFTVGVNQSIWYLPLVIFIVLIYLYYELKIKK